jgi:hypothetical protein
MLIKENNEMSLWGGVNFMESTVNSLMYESTMLDNCINICVLENSIDYITEEDANTDGDKKKQGKLQGLVQKLIEFLKSIPGRLKNLIGIIKNKFNKLLEFAGRCKQKFRQDHGKPNGKIVIKGYSYNIDSLITQRVNNIVLDIQGVKLNISLNRGTTDNRALSDINKVLSDLSSLIGEGTEDDICKYLLGDQDYSPKEQYFVIERELKVVDRWQSSGYVKELEKMADQFGSYFESLSGSLKSAIGKDLSQELVSAVSKLSKYAVNFVSTTLKVINNRLATAIKVVTYYSKNGEGTGENEKDGK